MCVRQWGWIINSALPLVAGQPYTEMPRDLFIPPDALEVLLDTFTGPLDLLLYLIRRQNIDIMDIPILLITQQYMQYIAFMGERRMELAVDYLVMAAVLAEIKSRLLLPVTPIDDERPDDDPRMDLVRRLQEYEQFKFVAKRLDALPRHERDVFQIKIHVDTIVPVKSFPDISLNALVVAMQGLLQREAHGVNHCISREPLSVRERMIRVLECLQDNTLLELGQLFSREEGRMGLVVSLLAVLELAKQAVIIVTQTALFSPVYLRAVLDE